jgi:hypothetical protein
MSLFRLTGLIAIVVLLLPTDPQRQAELSSRLQDVVGHTATICDRQPDTCTKARSLWDGFVAKSEFALTLVSNLARGAMERSPADQGYDRDDTASRSWRQPAPPAQQPSNNRWR